MSSLVGSIQGIAGTANNTVDKIGALAQGAMCISSSLIDILSDPSGLLGASKDFILGIIKSEIGLLTDLIQDEINFLIGVVTDQINKYIDMLNSILNIFNFLIQLLLDLERKIVDILKFKFDKESCDAAKADFARCLQVQISNMLTNKTMAALNGGLTSVDEFNKKIQQTLSENKTTNLFDDYANKAADQVNRANIKLTTINNINFLPK